MIILMGGVVMQNQEFIYRLLVVPCTLIILTTTSITFGLGQDTPEGWIGTEADYIDGDGAFFIDQQDTPGTTASVTGPSGNLTASPYSLHGSIGDDVFGLTSFMDELLFTTDNGNPGELVFNFDLNVDLSVLDTSQAAKSLFRINFWADHEGVDSAELLFEGDPGNYSASFYHTSAETPDQTWTGIDELHFSQTISFSTAGVTGSQLLDGGLVDNGSYLPITFEIYSGSLGEHSVDPTINVSIDWLNSFTLDPYDPINVYQDGTLLSLDQFGLTSMQGDRYINPIPSPSAVLLLGTGLLAFLRKKRL